MASSSRSGRSHKSSSSVTRASVIASRTEIIIHVYDLLPPGRLSSILWTIGGALLHSGVVIKDREYAYGGHDRKGVSGVYWTRPKLEPPGGTFRCDVLQGFTFCTPQEIDDIIHEASQRFQGTSYNLLTNNCNHFTSYLCEKLTSRPAPAYLNRAASVGLALPCVVPREWITPPDVDTADGELVDEENDSDNDENSGMLASDQRRRQREDVGPSDKRVMSRSQTPPPRKVSLKDTSGRDLPAGERAPMPKR